MNATVTKSNNLEARFFFGLVFSLFLLLFLLVIVGVDEIVDAFSIIDISLTASEMDDTYILGTGNSMGVLLVYTVVMPTFLVVNFGDIAKPKLSFVDFED